MTLFIPQNLPPVTLKIGKNNFFKKHGHVTCHLKANLVLIGLFHDGGPYQLETIPLISFANQWTGFYMIGITVIKKLKWQ